MDKQGWYEVASSNLSLHAYKQCKKTKLIALLLSHVNNEKVRSVTTIGSLFCTITFAAQTETTSVRATSETNSVTISYATEKYGEPHLKHESVNVISIGINPNILKYRDDRKTLSVAMVFYQYSTSITDVSYAGLHISFRIQCAVSLLSKTVRQKENTHNAFYRQEITRREPKAE